MHPDTLQQIAAERLADLYRTAAATRPVRGPLPAGKRRVRIRRLLHLSGARPLRAETR
jgi:hypothetical protein